MNINKLFILLLFGFSISSCTQKKEERKVRQKKIAKVEININANNTSKVNSLVMAYNDDFGNNIQYDYDFKKQKHYKLNIVNEIPIFLKDLSFNQTNYLIYPSEKLNLFIDTNGQIKLTTTQKNNIRDNELRFFNVLNLANLKSKQILQSALDKFPGIKENKKIKKADIFLEFLMTSNVKNPNDAINYSRLKYEEQVKFLEHYSTKYEISKQFKSLILQFFKYEDIRFRLAINYNATKLVPKITIANETPKLIAQLNCDSCLIIPHYKEAIIAYVKNLKTTSTQLNSKKIYQQLKQSFKGKTFDFAVFTLLKNTIDKDTSYQETYQEFLSVNKTVIFKDYLRKIDIIPSKNTILLKPNGEKTNLENLLTEHKGKVILFDFWASWCIPCKKQIPYSKKLKKELDSNKVAFIYLSVDSEVSSWETATKELDLPLSYLIMNGFSSTFANNLQIKSIPRYILIDKEGKIANKDAPRPDEPKLALLINQLINL